MGAPGRRSGQRGAGGLREAGPLPQVPALRGAGGLRRARLAQVTAHEEQLCRVGSVERGPRL